MIQKLRIILAGLVLSFITATSALAQLDQKDIVDQLNINTNSPDGTTLGLPQNDPNDIGLDSILETVFAVAAGLALIFIVVGGLRYILSDGNEQNIKMAKDTIVYAIVGLAISLSAFGIVRFVLSNVLS